MAKEVKESNVIARWGVLIQGQDQEMYRFFELVNWSFKTRGWTFPVQQVNVGNGKGKPYLETKRGKLIAYIGGTIIGPDMYVGWSLTLAEPRLFTKALSAAGAVLAAVFQELSFNEANSARGFAISLHNAVQQAIDVLCNETGFNTRTIDRTILGLLI